MDIGHLHNRRPNACLTRPVSLPPAPDRPATTDPLTGIPRLVVVGQVSEAVMVHDVTGGRVWTRERSVRVQVWILAGHGLLTALSGLFGQVLVDLWSVPGGLG